MAGGDEFREGGERGKGLVVREDSLPMREAASGWARAGPFWRASENFMEDGGVNEGGVGRRGREQGRSGRRLGGCVGEQGLEEITGAGSEGG